MRANILIGALVLALWGCDGSSTEAPKTDDHAEPTNADGNRLGIQVESVWAVIVRGMGHGFSGATAEMRTANWGVQRLSTVAAQERLRAESNRT